uniref:DNA replication initiation complex subunit (GINS family) n=1 Tax=Methanococcus maripaludis (strain C6 / ATCC BAA-1332) TaxID=444158 RepID=A9A8V3_METM6
MYKKIRDAFFNEFFKEGLSDLPENFYKDARNYLETIDDNTKSKRVKYYLNNLLSFRIYKVNCLKESSNKFVQDEKKVINFIEETCYGSGNEDYIPESDESDKKKVKFSVDLNKSEEKTDKCQIPKHINSESDIDIVRVITKFPCFTDGNLQYILNKNDVISLDRKFSKILEKHNIIKRVNIHEDEKKDEQVLPIL